MGIRRVNKRLKHPKVYSTTIDFASFYGGMNTTVDESILPIKYAKTSVNYIADKGTLKTGMGLKELTFPINEDDLNDTRTLRYEYAQQPLKVMHFRFFEPTIDKQLNRLLVYLDDGTMLFVPIFHHQDVYLRHPLFAFTSTPNLVNYRMNGEDIALFTSKTDRMNVWGPTTSLYVVENSPLMSSMCLHYERVFATVDGETSALWFSDSMDPTNWNVSSEEAGYIQFHDELGKANKVISFNNYLYVFRDFGITKVTAFAEQSTFAVNNIYFSSNAIYPQTVSVCGDSVFFMTSDGLYVFDGASVKKLSLGFEGIFDGIDNSRAIADYHKNCYYLICNTNIDGAPTKSGYNNSLIRVDVTSGEMSMLYGYDFVSLSAIRDGKLEKLIVIIRDSDDMNKILELTEDGKVLGNATKKIWQSAYTDLGYPDRKKHIRALYIQSETDCTVTLTSETSSAVVNVYGGDKPKRYPLNLSGVMVKIKIESELDSVNISHPCFEVVLGGENV